MILDSTLLSARDAGSAFNILGLAIPLLLFVVILRYWRLHYVVFWALNYLLTLVTIGLEAASAQAGHPLWLSAPAMLTFTAASACLVSAAEQLYGRPAMNRWLGGGLAALAVWVVAAPFAGLSYLTVVAPTVLFNILGHVLVGIAFWRREAPRRNTHLPGFLGGWTIFTGLWAFAYVVCEPLELVWFGTVVAGVNHLVVAAAVLLYLMDDVTGRLAHQNEQLLDMDRLKNEFLANVSHELRTPLSAIKAGTWLLAAGKYAEAPAVREEVLGTIATNTDHLIRLIEDLLDYAKMGAGGITFDVAPGDLAETVRGALQQSAALFEEKGLTLVTELPERLEAPHDAVKLGQVVTNLLANAVKFTPAPGRVTLRLAREATESGARLTVEDSGPGIPAQQLEAVFDRFYQVDGSATRRAGGTGLGLAICKAIVEEGHHGRIWAENVPGGGARVVVALPLALSSATPARLP